MNKESNDVKKKKPKKEIRYVYGISVDEWKFLIPFVGVLALVIVGCFWFATTVDIKMPERPEYVPTATLLREGMVEDIQLFQHGALNESRTLIEFTEARSIIIGGHLPLESGVMYRIWYQEYPYTYDAEVPVEAHTTLVRYEITGVGG